MNHATECFEPGVTAGLLVSRIMKSASRKIDLSLPDSFGPYLRRATLWVPSGSWGSQLLCYFASPTCLKIFAYLLFCALTRTPGKLGRRRAVLPRVNGIWALPAPYQPAIARTRSWTSASAE